MMRYIATESKLESRAREMKRSLARKPFGDTLRELVAYFGLLLLILTCLALMFGIPYLADVPLWATPAGILFGAGGAFLMWFMAWSVRFFTRRHQPDKGG